MNFTIEDVDQVIERTGCSYREAKEALIKADGNVIDAIILMEEERTEGNVMAKIEKAIKEGNVNRIEIREPDGRTLTSVSVNMGAALGASALLFGAAPLVAISALIAKYGLKYQFVIVKADGSETVI